MAKSVSNSVLDAALNYIKNNVDEMNACSAEPTTYTEAITTYSLADVAMSGTDMTVGDGDASGRKVAVAEKTGVTVDADGTATHVALTYSGGTELVYVTTCTSQGLTSGNTMTFQTWDIEIADPT